MGATKLSADRNAMQIAAHAAHCSRVERDRILKNERNIYQSTRHQLKLSLDLSECK